MSANISNANEPLSRLVLDAWSRADNNEPYDPDGVNTSEWDRVLARVRDEGGFHWRNGVYFRRLDDGTVRVTQFYAYSNHCPNYRYLDIPSLEWDSIVKSVSPEEPRS